MFKPTIQLIFFLVVLISSSKTSAQLKWDPTAKEISFAKELKEKYSDEDVKIVVTSALEQISFSVNKKTKKLNVKQHLQEHLMSISEHPNIVKYVFYDNNTKITKFRITNKLNKKKHIKPTDEYMKINGIFYHDQRVTYAPLTFPTIGYRLNFEYKKKYSDPKYFTSIFFMQDEPVLKKKIIFTIPKYAKIELFEKNFDGFDITKTSKFDSKKNATVITYVLKNLPAIYKEEDKQGPTYLLPHILVQIKEYTHRGQKHTVFNTLKDQYNWYYSLLKQLKENPLKLSKTVSKLTKNAKNDEEKIKNIFYWVQDNIRYIAFEDGIAGFKPDESQNVYAKRYGDCKGMANLTTAMLKKAGFDARRTWIGTRRIAYDYTIPSLAVDNHMICTLFLNGKTYYLDATESYIPLGEYAERIQGRQVLIENKKNYILKKIPVSKAIENINIYKSTIKIEGENMIGSISKISKGNSRTDFLQAYNTLKNDIKDDVLKNYLKRNDDNLVLSNLKTSDLKNREKNINISYDFILSNNVSSFDNEMYVDIDLEKKFKNLDLEKRQTPYQFSHKIYNKSEIVFEIPNGYRIEELPKNIHAENEDFTVDIQFKIIENKLYYNKTFIFPKALIQKKNFDQWQKVYKQINNLYQSQLTLIK
jgi:transglutaminase-like putative cysteine protease